MHKKYLIAIVVTCSVMVLAVALVITHIINLAHEDQKIETEACRKEARFNDLLNGLTNRRVAALKLVPYSETAKTKTDKNGYHFESDETIIYFNSLLRNGSMKSDYGRNLAGPSCKLVLTCDDGEIFESDITISDQLDGFDISFRYSTWGERISRAWIPLQPGIPKEFESVITQLVTDHKQRWNK